MNKDVCECCGHTEIHYNSCKNVNYPSCQAYDREVWIHKQIHFKCELFPLQFYQI